MTISEFRAWLDGFKEAVGDAPTPEQWAKVLAKLGEVHAVESPLPQPAPFYPGTQWPPAVTSGDPFPLRAYTIGGSQASLTAN